VVGWTRRVVLVMGARTPVEGFSSCAVFSWPTMKNHPFVPVPSSDIFAWARESLAAQMFSLDFVFDFF
jgi:hypothetical protein